VNLKCNSEKWFARSKEYHFVQHNTVAKLKKKELFFFILANMYEVIIAFIHSTMQTTTEGG